MNLQIIPRVSEEYVITQIMIGYRTNFDWIKKPILLSNLSVDKEYSEPTEEELLEIKRQFGFDSFIFTPFRDSFGIPSFFTPLDYELGLRRLGYQIARVIQLEREEALNPGEYKKQYADGFRMSIDNNFLSSYDKSTGADEFLVYRRLMDRVSYNRSKGRDMITTKKDYEDDLTFQAGFYNSGFYIRNPHKLGIRTYIHICTMEQAYWSFIYITPSVNLIKRAIYLTCKMYGSLYAPIKSII